MRQNRRVREVRRMIPLLRSTPWQRDGAVRNPLSESMLSYLDVKDETLAA